jgi:hypothetical protein
MAPARAFMMARPISTAASPAAAPHLAIASRRRGQGESSRRLLPAFTMLWA